MTLADILKDSNYSLAQFHREEINALEAEIFFKETKTGQKPYITCLVRNKDIQLKPEEVIRQLYLKVLTERYHYPINRLQVEYVVTFGREKKYADIAIMDKDRPTVPYIIIELKKPKLKDGKEQLKSYCNATGAPMGVWTNGEQISYYQRKDPNYFEAITDIPNVNQTLADILQIKFTLADLIENDELTKKKKSLKTLIEEMEDEVLANAGVDVFEELFKLIFTKLYDEWVSGQGNQKNKRLLEFRNTGQTDTALKDKIQRLFDKAKEKWEGVFNPDAKITLTPSHLSVCVSSLENVKLFNSNLDVIDEAFEYLINQSSKGEKGQFFTPRYVIDMCVKMLNPQEDEYLIDTAAGSSGFPVHAMFHVWRQILEDEGIEGSHLFSLEEKPPRCAEYVQKRVFAIDFDEKAVRVARTSNLIAGDGQTNVLHLNTLDFKRWDERIKEEDWNDTYNEGFKRFKKLRRSTEDYKEFNFDILMANPPFAGDIKETAIISHYELAKKNGKSQGKIGRDILFIERNLDFLKPGGRMAIVLPQGRFNNASDKYIRDYIADRCRILAVVGLHGNTFKPHTGTKTSVLLVQKWDDKLCPKKEDYPIFFATMQKSGKDNSGEKSYVKDEDGSRKLDSHGHIIIDHDLFNHEGMTDEGIAEAFIEFAKKEGLSFFDLSLSVTPFDMIKYQGLMDRLEAVELRLSKLEKFLRIDAEVYQKLYISINELISGKNNTTLGNEAKKIKKGIFDIKAECYTHQGFPFVRISNLKNMQIDDSEIIYIPKEEHENNKDTELLKNDVILSKTAYPAASIVTLNVCNTSQDTIAVKLLKNSKVNSHYLVLFLNCKYGYYQMKRWFTGNIQMHLNLDDCKRIIIPILNVYFQTWQKNIFNYSLQLLQRSRLIYQQAEELLLTELGLKDWKPTEKSVTIKSFSDSFLASGRLDAEYYQPKYDELNKLINSNSLYTNKIGDIQEFNARGLQPEYVENGNLYIINSRHILDDHLDYENFEKTDISYWDIQKKANVYRNDILTYTTGANIGRTNIYLIDQKALASNHVNILRINNEHPIYVGFVMNSIIGRLQTEKLCAGSAQVELYPKDIEQFIIPFISKRYQQKIIDYYIESLALKQKSKRLLEIAKIGVEKAIETDEETATQWINEQLEELGVKLESSE